MVVKTLDNRRLEQPPRLRDAKEASRNLLIAQPPLLSQGGEFRYPLTFCTALHWFPSREVKLVANASKYLPFVAEVQA